MKARLLGVAALLGVAFAIGNGESRAGTIGPGDFGPQAQIETFESMVAVVAARGSNQFGDPSLALNGATYSFVAPGYRIETYNAANYRCISGACLGNGATGAFWTITLDTPVNRVGGYLNGTNLVASQTDVTYYDANNAYLGSENPIPLPNTANPPFFFGFQTDTDIIKFVRIAPSNGQGETTLDNFTSEIIPTTPLPAALPLFATGAGVMSLLAWRRKRKASAALAAA